jgi:hypothetical protein
MEAASFYLMPMQLALNKRYSEQQEIALKKSKIDNGFKLTVLL